MEENFTPTELWLGMHLSLAYDDMCPFANFKVKKFVFCEAREGDECPKAKSGNWILEIGKCWVRFARLQSKEAVSLEKQVWQEYRRTWGGGEQ